MRFWRWTVPIRLKIMILVGASLTFSLVAYLYLANTLMIQDKASYIYDYNYSHVVAASERLDGRIRGAAASARMMATLIGHPSLERIFDEHSKSSALAGVVILRPVSEGRFVRLAALGPGAKRAEGLMEELTWTPKIFAQASTFVGPLQRNLLPIGGTAADTDGKPVAFVALLRLTPEDLGESPGEMRVYLVDSAGVVRTVNKREGDRAPSTELRDLAAGIASGKAESGVRDLELGGSRYMAGFKKAGYGKLTVLSLIPREVAFSATRTLAVKSVILGFCILLLSIGLTLIFIKSVTRKIREMWHATQKVSAGDFSVRVKCRKTGGDELDGLALSFNAMSDRVRELLDETAEKARMQTELKTAQAVQETLFPLPVHEFGGIRLAAFYEPASECGGDWWYYCEMGDLLFIWIGDVTGHGVSAALLTSAAKSAAAVIEDLCLKSPAQALAIMNRALHQTAKGKIVMTFFLAALDRKTGELTYANAAHEPPFLVRRADGTVNQSCFNPLSSVAGSHLGENPAAVYEEGRTQLEPGDVLTFFTDGLYDIQNPKGRRMGKGALVRALVEILAEPRDAEAISHAVRAKVESFRQRVPLDDDMTFIACRYDRAS